MSEEFDNRDRSYLSSKGWIETMGGWKREDVFRGVPITEEEAIGIQEKEDSYYLGVKLS